MRINCQIEISLLCKEMNNIHQRYPPIPMGGILGSVLAKNIYSLGVAIRNQPSNEENLNH